MWHRSWMLRCSVVLALAACGDRGAPVATERATPVPIAADAGLAPQPVLPAPHGAEIALVAVTDDARAAITSDDNGELRFWPSLDGKQEPVVLRGHAPSDLVLAREHDGFVAALLDAATGIEVLHLAKDGALRDRQLMPAEPGYVEMVAAETAILARRSDQTIVRIDSNARTHVLAPAAGDQILGLAARGDDAVAGIADPERPAEIHVVRELALANGLAWGKTYALPIPLVAPFALSPSGRRIAGIDARTSMGVVIELGGQSRVIASDVIADAPDRTIGFLDDDRVVFRGGILVSVPLATAADPWTGTHSSVRVRLGRSTAIADGFGIGGIGTHLLIADGKQTRFLGYRDLGIADLRVTGSQITLSYGTRVLWLDERLREHRSRDVLADAIGGLAVDDTHLLKATFSYLAEDRSQLDLSLFDVVTGAYAGLGMYPQASNVSYDPGTGVYAVWGQTREVPRARLDLSTRTSAPLRSLRTRGDATVELLDPAVANGAVAVAYSGEDGGMLYVETFVDDLKSNRPLAPASTVKIQLAVQTIGTDRTGAMYTLVEPSSRGGKAVLVHKGGKEVKKIMVDDTATSGAVDRDGTTLAAYSRNEIVLYAIDGPEAFKERWRVPAWSVNIAMFTADGKTLLVNTQGGLMALDTMTGARAATGCGWGFGLSTTEPQLAIFITPVVCAEAP
jgi:hypothetical protein